MRCAVIVFPGSNCDSDLYKAVNSFEGVDAEYVWYTTENLDPFDLILLPGGFAYGDYLRAGALAARTPVLKALIRAAERCPGDWNLQWFSGSYRVRAFARSASA